ITGPRPCRRASDGKNRIGLRQRDAMAASRSRSGCSVEYRRERTGDHVCLLQCSLAGLCETGPDAGPQGDVGRTHGGSGDVNHCVHVHSTGLAVSDLRLPGVDVSHRQEPVLSAWPARPIVVVDPKSKLVLVQTALADNEISTAERVALFLAV